MNHPTTTQLMEFLDGALSPSDRQSVEFHLTQCSQCADEMRFQQSLLRSARRQRLHRPSRGFTNGVMRRILPQNKRSLADRFLRNAGPIVAMTMVVAIITYAFSLGPSPETSQTGQILKQAKEWFASASEAMKSTSVELPALPTQTQSPDQRKLIALIFISFIVLVIVDRFLLQGRFRARSRRL